MTTTSIETNKASVGRMVEELCNRGDLAVADQLYAADYIRHDPATPDAGTGTSAIKQVINNYRTAFSDLHFTSEDLLADGDKVILRWSVRGTHRGDLQGLAPTGKEVAMEGISIYHFVDGRIAEEWTNWDTLGMLRQLGVNS